VLASFSVLIRSTVEDLSTSAKSSGHPAISEAAQLPENRAMYIDQYFSLLNFPGTPTSSGHRIALVHVVKARFRSLFFYAPEALQ
jgi:hypothetical protein